MVNSQAKGKRAERDVCAAFSRAGLPARRHVRTGTRDVADEGDIRLDTAPVTIEVKDWSKGITEKVIRDLLAKLETQKRPGDLGLLVVKRYGEAHAERWACWVSGIDATRLLTGVKDDLLPLGDGVHMACGHPVGFVLADVLSMLVAGGWSTQLVNPFG